MTSSTPHGMTRRELRERAEALRGTNERVRILTVCTGNICRSPMAEALLRARLGSDRFVVHSAGTRALVDKPMTAEAQDQNAA